MPNPLPNLLAQPTNQLELESKVDVCPSLPVGVKGMLEERHLQHERELQDLVYLVRHVVCAELSSLNQKLDRLAGDARHDAEKTAVFQYLAPRSPLRSPSHFKSSPSVLHCASPVAPKDDVSRATPGKGFPGFDPSASASVAKLHKLRPKIRFIGTLMAAAKRANRQRSFDDSKAGTPRLAHNDRSGLSKKPSNHSLGGIAHMMSPMWDFAAEARMDRIQKFLNADSSKQTLRLKFWRLTERPFSSKLAFAYAWIINILVMSSVLVHLLHADFVDYVRLGLEVFFAIDFLLRLVCCQSLCIFMRSYFNWIDLLSIIPLGLRLLASEHRHSQAVLALVPMLRLFKPLRRFEKLRLLKAAFGISLEALPLLLYTLALIAMVFAEIFFFLEPRSNIKDLPAALWFTMVTMTTVGYGDVTPTTNEGHVAASVLMVVSALYMAMPLGIVGDAFSRVWADRDRLLVIKRFRGTFFERGFSLKSLKDVFDIFDEDGSGALDVDEFTVMLQTMQMKMTEERINFLFATLDKEGKGEITLERLSDLLAPKALSAQIFQRTARLPTVTLNPLSFISGGICRSTSVLEEEIPASVDCVSSV